MTEVVIIGAGPAGLHAASRALDAGATVVLLDSADMVGGQFWRRPSTQPVTSDPKGVGHQWATFARIDAQLSAHPRCRILTNAEVWAIEPREGGAARVHVLSGPSGDRRREELVLEPDRLVLATGGHDRVLPFPGWQRPGVVTAGAAQTLAKAEQLAVGTRVLVAGSGPFLLATAASLLSVGAQVVGIHEASRPRALGRGWLSRPWELARSGERIGELASFVKLLVSQRVPYVLGSGILAAHGSDRVSSVSVGRLDPQWRPIPGTEQEIAVDAVAVGHGFTPRLELALALGCSVSDPAFVEVDANQETSVPGVLAAGEITGIGGMRLASVEGAIAGLAAGGAEIPPRLRTERDRQQAFAGRMARAHAIQPGWRQWLTQDTCICRCEDVSYAALVDENLSTQSLRSAKVTTRAGLGLCQGRMCGRTVEEILRTDRDVRGSASFDRRPIAAPIRLAELAREQSADLSDHHS